MTVICSLLFNAVFFGLTFVLSLVGAAIRPFGADSIMALARLWARLSLGLARWICGIRFEVIGLERIAPGAALIASRHQSAFDTMVWLTLMPRCCYVLKQELLRIPVFGWLIKATRMIAVDRKGGGAALRTLMRLGEQAAREGRQIVIFPEGTRSPPGALLPLQPGVAALASRTRLPVIPVVTDSGLYWGRRAFRKRPGTIRIVVCPPLPRDLPRDALMQQLRQALEIPTDQAAELVDNPVSCGAIKL
jgi:1-acyl-sn-glycerol-3-phosphate acyltransferase